MPQDPLAAARKALLVHGPTIERYRLIVPLAILLVWILRETAWYRFAVSIDKKLIEVGWSQAPIYRAYQLHVDPFDTIGSLWLACLEANKDADYWRAIGSDDEQRLKIASWLTKCDANLWYCVIMDYSLGTGGLRHALLEAIKRAERKGRGPDDLGLMNEVIDWAEHTNLAAPEHTTYWGRAEPDIVDLRIHKHEDWIIECQKLGPLDGPPGGTPPEERPLGVPDFPSVLVNNAKLAARKDTTPEQRLVNWQEVKDYAAARARREIKPKEVMAFLEAQKDAQVALVRGKVYGDEAIIRD